MAVGQAELLIGAGRLLNPWRDTIPCREALLAEDIYAAIQEHPGVKICVLFSGDSGFYSGARLLLPMLREWEVCLLPGISSLQIFAARLQRPWQDWRLCSAHGIACDAVHKVCMGKPVFFLTGGKNGPAEICRTLCDAGLGFLQVTVGEDLGTANERISEMTAEIASESLFSPLSVLLCEAAPRTEKRTPGLPDACFERSEKVPMTKQVVRAAVLAKLSVRPDEVCWDIGAGTGSVSVELALQAREVWAVEREEKSLTLAEENRKKHGAWNLHLIAGTAPEAMETLPEPDAVFVGGSGGMLREILHGIHKRNGLARICVSAVTLEGLQTACSVFRELGYDTDICQICVNRGKSSGELTLMLAQNPVWLITGTK